MLPNALSLEIWRYRQIDYPSIILAVVNGSTDTNQLIINICKANEGTLFECSLDLFSRSGSPPNLTEYVGHRLPINRVRFVEISNIHGNEAIVGSRMSKN